MRTLKSHYLTGETLTAFLGTVDIPEYKRAIYWKLDAYLNGEEPDRVCELHGNPRTGKRTLIYQAMQELPPEQTMFIKIDKREDLSEIRYNLGSVCADKIRYIFVCNSTAGEYSGESSYSFSTLVDENHRIVITDQSLIALDCAAYAYFKDYADGDYSYTKIYRIETDLGFDEYSIMTGINDPLQYAMYGGMCPDRKGRHGFANESVARKHAFLATRADYLSGESTSGDISILRGTDRAEALPYCLPLDRKVIEIDRILYQTISDMMSSVVTNQTPPKRQSPVQMFTCCKDTCKKNVQEQIRQIFQSNKFAHVPISYIHGENIENGMYFDFIQPAVSWQFALMETSDMKKLEAFKRRTLERIAATYTGRNKEMEMVRLISFDPYARCTGLLCKAAKSETYTLLEFCHSDTGVVPAIICNPARIRLLEKHFGQIVKTGVIWYGADNPDRKYHDIRNFLGKASDIQTWTIGQD